MSIVFLQRLPGHIQFILDKKKPPCLFSANTIDKYSKFPSLQERREAQEINAARSG
jgi:hypothetical protein